VQELDTADDDFPGRHRAPASVVRKLSVRLGLAALGVLLTVGLGAATADVLGLTEVGQLAAGDPLRAIPPATEEEPRAGRTVELPTRPALPAPRPDTQAPDPSPELPVAPAPADEPSPAPVAAAPAPVRTVRTGDSCRDVGQSATTDRGKPAVCTASRGNGPSKWRSA
jgi:hypothetical protein